MSFAVRHTAGAAVGLVNEIAYSNYAQSVAARLSGIVHRLLILRGSLDPISYCCFTSLHIWVRRTVGVINIIQPNTLTPCLVQPYL